MQKLKSIELKIPPQSQNRATMFKNCQAVSDWVESLPVADAQGLGKQLISALDDLNRTVLPFSSRVEFMEILRPLTRAANENLENYYLHSTFPLSPRVRNAYNLSQHILEQMATGYKILVNELMYDEPNSIHKDVLALSLYHAISYLARILVCRYMIYAPEPKKVWFEIHQLYLFAKALNLEANVLAIERKRGDTRKRSIDMAYKRILLLSRAAPYHLMQGEANHCYQLMEAWSGNCKLSNIDCEADMKDGLVIDAYDDKAPFFVLKDQQKFVPMQGWLLNCDEISEQLDKKISAYLTLPSDEENGPNVLKNRMERDMYFRLSDAWATRQERKEDRPADTTACSIVIGLSGCHYMFSEGGLFTPEKDELNVLAAQKVLENSKKNTPELKFAEHDEYWRLHNAHESEGQGRLSDFSRFEDAWGNVNVHLAQHQVQQKNMQLNIGCAEYQPSQCVLKDKNSGGLKLYCDRNSGVQMRVGELLCFKGEDDVSYKIGSVRWLTCEKGNNLSIGVRFIAENAKAVATRALKGVGHKGEYVRALVITDMEGQQTMITPAAVYDINTILLVNMGNELKQVRLTELIEATNAYSRYKYKALL